jgi:RNA polymerase-associated protein RTF1
MQLSEIEREQILSQRLEEKQRLKDKRMISQMVKDQRNGEGESVSKAAKRPCTSPSLPTMTYICSPQDST